MSLLIINRKGITLIELIIFIIIAGIFVPLTYMAFTASMGKAAYPEGTLRARFVAEETMENAVKRGFNQLESDIASTPTCSAIGVSVPTGYSCAWTPAYVQYSAGTGTFVASGLSDYIMLTVTVTPAAGTGYAHTVQTIVSRRL
jgi:type II secretory pathway pseudopilin PulG